MNTPTAILLEQCHILSEVTIDALEFKVTLCPLFPSACLLWARDNRLGEPFRVLGRFSHFDKSTLLQFIVRYCLSPELREEIADRIFDRRLSSLSPDFFRHFERMTTREKEAAYRSLFDLDGVMHEAPAETVAHRRRVMAKRFHPDHGGDTRAMVVINEAFEHLTKTRRP